MITHRNLCAPLRKTVLAFRGYNVTNLGRTPELLAHPAYGPIVEAHLREASEILAATLKRPADLAARVREGRDTNGLIDYAEDVALIVAVEVAHLRILEKFFGITVSQGVMRSAIALGNAGR